MDVVAKYEYILAFIQCFITYPRTDTASSLLW
jgi:hypothetical protein